MKKLVLLFALLCKFSPGDCQALFSFGNNTVTKDEFLKAYNKNNTTAGDNAQAMRDYLALYIKFRLKVQAAKDLRIDTLSTVKTDLHDFRIKIEDNYLNDNIKVNALLDEAFSRSQKDIHVLHFFVPEGTLSTDSMKPLQAIKEVDAQLKASKKSVREILAGVNKDGVVVEYSDAGFITVFSLPYEYENIIYGLKPGQSSIPYHSRKGWHIFKNVEERPAVGKVKLAQILLAVPEGSKTEELEVKKLADSIYDELEKGADFGILAKEYSDDRMTYEEGGVMPEFGVSKYGGDFAEMAFSLHKDEELSRPFKTAFGYHIIKRIAASPVPATKNDDTFMFNLKKEVLNDSRIDVARQQFVAAILPKTGFKKGAVDETDLWRVSDSSLLANRNITSGQVDEKTILFSYNDNSKVNVADWILFLRNSNKTQPAHLHETYKKLFFDFIAASATRNYSARLQYFNEDFKDQLDEFKEGNMLFEVMEREVWSKAFADSAGLRDYYNSHKEKYWWETAAEAIIFSCANRDVAKKAMEELGNGKSWREVMSNNISQVQADSGRYELGQIPVAGRTNFTEGLITAPVVNENDGTAIFAKILKLYPGRQPRNFEEARGLAINDYQTFLEEKWIEQLKKQYPIKISEKVFTSLLK